VFCARKEISKNRVCHSGKRLYFFVALEAEAEMFPMRRELKEEVFTMIVEGEMKQRCSR
jgi:hypothetical protein